MEDELHTHPLRRTLPAATLLAVLTALLATDQTPSSAAPSRPALTFATPGTRATLGNRRRHVGVAVLALPGETALIGLSRRVLTWIAALSERPPRRWPADRVQLG